MKNALDDTNAAFTKATNIKVTASYAASSALAKQLESGVVLNAAVLLHDPKQMDRTMKDIEAAGKAAGLPDNLRARVKVISGLDNLSEDLYANPGFETMLATLVLSSRYRPLPVLVGVGAASTSMAYSSSR